jgi:rubredoxin
MSAGTDSGATGELAVLPADAQLECGVCWWVYDPALGDPFAQVAPGTPFAALPAHWRCPNCDAPKARFLVVGQ